MPEFRPVGGPWILGELIWCRTTTKIIQSTTLSQLRGSPITADGLSYASPSLAAGAGSGNRTREIRLEI